MARNRELEDPRRRVLVRALSLGALGGAWIPDAAAQLFGNRPGTLPAGRSIYRLVGEVGVNGKAATLQTVVNPGDTVRTGKGSECIFVVAGHSMIMRENSSLTIDAQEADSGLVRGLRILAGALLQVSRGSRIGVTTANASIGIRGTGFYVEAEPNRTYFCTCYGVTDIAAASDPDSRETITATHHDRPVYVVSDAARGKGIRNAPFVNHTDQELALIEALVGREPPFVFPKDSYGGPRREY
ncbi:MAG: FecR domain-containing protein [Usitatibacter sp.]